MDLHLKPEFNFEIEFGLVGRVDLLAPLTRNFTLKVSVGSPYLLYPEIMD